MTMLSLVIKRRSYLEVMGRRLLPQFLLRQQGNPSGKFSEWKNFSVPEKLLDFVFKDLIQMININKSNHRKPLQALGQGREQASHFNLDNGGHFFRPLLSTCQRYLSSVWVKYFFRLKWLYFLSESFRFCLTVGQKWPKKFCAGKYENFNSKLRKYSQLVHQNLWESV